MHGTHLNWWTSELSNTVLCKESSVDPPDDLADKFWLVASVQKLCRYHVLLVQRTNS
jgi:hypothetical protein